MSTTQEDYFGNAIDTDAPPRRHKEHRRHKHSKPRAYTPSDSEDEPELSSRESYQDEREYMKKPSRRHRHREHIQPVVSEPDTDGASTDDERERRRRRRHRRKERVVPDDASSTIAEAESATDSEATESVRGSHAGSNGRMRDRAKSMGENAIEALGLGETYRRARSKSRGRRSESIDSDEGYDTNSERSTRSRSSSRMNSNTAQAALIAAAVEAFRARKEPGGVTGSKGLKRVVEAAVASGAVEKFLDRKGEDDGKGNRRIAESVLAGLAAQRGLNGKRSKRRGDGDEKASMIRDLAASGLIAAAGKKFLDYQRSRSQSRPRGRSNSESPERPGLDRRRSRSMGQALAAMGLGGLAAERFGRSRRDSQSSKSSRRSGGYRDDSSSDSSLLDSDLSLDEDGVQERHKKLRRKEIISVALAILATLHLGHVGYEAKEKRALRKEKLDSGRITEEEADKLRNKAILKDATAVGLAILAAAEAVKALKSMQNSRHTYRNFEEKRPKIEEHRRQKMIQQPGGDISTTPSRGEASRYYGQPGYMGPPPGARVTVPVYPTYPTAGPIPATYGGRDAYSSRDGRDIPVVYPTSVTHA